jgi:hypothetical protein
MTNCVANNRSIYRATILVYAIRNQAKMFRKGKFPREEGFLGGYNFRENRAWFLLGESS